MLTSKPVAVKINPSRRWPHDETLTSKIDQRETSLGRGGRRHSSEYVSILAEVFFDKAKGQNGVRPCEGEQFSSSLKIECARVIRSYPIGTIVRLDVVETERDGGKPFLYSSYKWRHEKIN